MPDVCCCQTLTKRGVLSSPFGVVFMKLSAAAYGHIQVTCKGEPKTMPSRTTCPCIYPFSAIYHLMLTNNPHFITIDHYFVD